jgi:hypothetical protein
VRLDRPDHPRQTLAQLVEAHGTPVAGLARWSLTHRFPEVETLASGSLAGLGLSSAGQRRLQRFASGVAEGAVVLDRSVGQADLAAQLAPLGPCAADLAAELACRLGLSDVAVVNPAAWRWSRLPPDLEPAASATG